MIRKRSKSLGQPEVLANKTLKQVADHTTQVITALDKSR